MESLYGNRLYILLTVLGPQAHIPEGGNIRDNTAELLKVCGDIRDSTAELVQLYWVLFSYYCPCIQLCVEDYCHLGAVVPMGRSGQV